MTIKELEQKSGVSRANIRYYESEGLLHPGRLANGYRNYTEDDLQELLRIRLLRGLRVPLDEIRKVQQGSCSLAEMMARQEAELQREQDNLARSREVCHQLAQETGSYETIDASVWLPKLSGEELPEPARWQETFDYPFAMTAIWATMMFRGGMVSYLLLLSGIPAVLRSLASLRRQNRYFNRAFLAATLLQILVPLDTLLLCLHRGEIIQEAFWRVEGISSLILLWSLDSAVRQVYGEKKPRHRPFLLLLFAKTGIMIPVLLTGESYVLSDFGGLALLVFFIVILLIIPRLGRDMDQEELPCGSQEKNLRLWLVFPGYLVLAAIYAGAALFIERPAVESMEWQSDDHDSAEDRLRELGLPEELLSVLTPEELSAWQDAVSVSSVSANSQSDREMDLPMKLTAAYLDRPEADGILILMLDYLGTDLQFADAISVCGEIHGREEGMVPMYFFPLPECWRVCYYQAGEERFSPLSQPERSTVSAQNAFWELSEVMPYGEAEEVWCTEVYAPSGSRGHRVCAVFSVPEYENDEDWSWEPGSIELQVICVHTENPLAVPLRTAKERLLAAVLDESPTALWEGIVIPAEISHF